MSSSSTLEVKFYSWVCLSAARINSPTNTTQYNTIYGRRHGHRIQMVLFVSIGSVITIFLALWNPRAPKVLLGYHFITKGSAKKPKQKLCLKNGTHSSHLPHRLPFLVLILSHTEDCVYLVDLFRMGMCLCLFAYRSAFPILPHGKSPFRSAATRTRTRYKIE